MYARTVALFCGVFLAFSCSAPVNVPDGGTSDGSPDEDGGADGGDADADADADADSDSDADVDADADGDGGPACEEETCFDGLDNDCDGEVDEECPCEPGEVASCYRGGATTRGVGLCGDGEMLCTGSYEFGVWGPCEGDVLPTEETCDAGGADEDCDGAANDGCECVDGDPDLPCGSGEGACEPGVQSCVDGHWTECDGAVGPEAEVCNGVDDDCDGVVDDDVRRACGSDVGACRPGTETCEDGEWGDCLGGNPPTDEACDGLDNDCDGETDEEVTRDCGSDVGRCVAGTETCAGGAFGPCEGAIGPTGETCNGVDDDCDGETDEELSRSCGVDVGLCETGTETCASGGWGACEGATWPATELCDGVLDEDCDGTVDEECDCTSGATRGCGTDEGVCVAGTQVCDLSGAWGPCLGAVEPSPELCNGVDDDCDAETDEGCACIDGDTRSCGTDVGLCVSGTETCDLAGLWGPCTGATGPTTEVCNDEDDDCDGETDEDDVCPRFPPVAVCPGDDSTIVGDTVSLVGGGSDPDGGAVTFAWTVSSAPVGSVATPSPADGATAYFTPDEVGDYILRLCVTDDEGETACCTVDVTALSPCVPPSAPAVWTCPTSWDRRPVVEFDPVPSGIVYELFVTGDATPYATVSLVGQNHHRPSVELAAGAPPPGDPISIHVRACEAGSPSCCATSESVDVTLVEACTTAIAPTASNIAFSEYVINGDGACPGDDCEAGEAIEITNLSNCPITLSGHHFAYCNSTCSAFRWMNFGGADVIPPRGVYVAIRNVGGSSCSYPFFGPDDPGLFGLRISALAMESDTTLATGWFNNSGGGDSVLRIATGSWVSITGGTTLEVISPYLGSAAECESIGWNAVDECGEVSSVSTPTGVLSPNQLGRLWHPCDAVVTPVPDTCY